MANSIERLPPSSSSSSLNTTQPDKPTITRQAPQPPSTGARLITTSFPNLLLERPPTNRPLATETTHFFSPGTWKIQHLFAGTKKPKAKHELPAQPPRLVHRVLRKEEQTQAAATAATQSPHVMSYSQNQGSLSTFHAQHGMACVDQFNQHITQLQGYLRDKHPGVAKNYAKELDFLRALPSKQNYSKVFYTEDVLSLAAIADYIADTETPDFKKINVLHHLCNELYKCAAGVHDRLFSAAYLTKTQDSVTTEVQRWTMQMVDEEVGKKESEVHKATSLRQGMVQKYKLDPDREVSAIDKPSVFRKWTMHQLKEKINKTATADRLLDHLTEDIMTEIREAVVQHQGPLDLDSHRMLCTTTLANLAERYEIDLKDMFLFEFNEDETNAVVKPSDDTTLLRAGLLHTLTRHGVITDAVQRHPLPDGRTIANCQDRAWLETAGPGNTLERSVFDAKTLNGIDPRRLPQQLAKTIGRDAVISARDADEAGQISPRWILTPAIAQCLIDKLGPTRKSIWAPIAVKLFQRSGPQERDSLLMTMAKNGFSPGEARSTKLEFSEAFKPGMHDVVTLTAQNDVDWILDLSPRMARLTRHKDPGNGPVSTAVRNGHVGVVQALLGAGFAGLPRDASAQLRNSAQTGDIQALDAARQAGVRFGPEHRHIAALAAKHKQLDYLKRLHALGVPMRTHLAENRILLEGVRSGDLATVEFLLNNGANANLQHVYSFPLDEAGSTNLVHLAINNNDLPMVRLLMAGRNRGKR